MKREIFRLTAAEQVGIYFGPLITLFHRLLCRKSKTLNKLQKNHTMFNNAKNRYESELDMIKLLKSVRDSENFRKTFLSKP